MGRLLRLLLPLVSACAANTGEATSPSIDETAEQRAESCGSTANPIIDAYGFSTIRADFEAAI